MRLKKKIKLKFQKNSISKGKRNDKKKDPEKTQTYNQEETDRSDKQWNRV